MPTYKVTDKVTGKIVIVDNCRLPAQAVRLVSGDRFEASILGASEGIALFRQGVEIIDAQEDPSQPQIPTLDEPVNVG